MLKGAGSSRRSGWCASVAITLLLALAQTALGQITAATISGTIKDETGGVLPGVDVIVKSVDTGQTRATVTNETGFFTVPGLQPGKYEARATLQGFSTAVQGGIVLAVGQEAGLNLTMKVGGAEETINVVAAAMLVDTRSSTLSALVTEKTIEELPLNGRNYISLATLQPGIINFTEKSGTSSSTRGTQLNINGMGGRSNSFLIDGANMKGYAGIATVTAADSTLGVETIREFRVVTNSFSADYGRAMGGVVTIVTKAGTNEVHGSGFEFYRNSKMDARNFFDPGAPPPFTRHQVGVSGGGPIRKNQIFFFGGYERLQEDLGITNPMTVPTDAVRAGAVNPAVRQYLDLFPHPNGRELGGGIAEYNYEFNRPTRENYWQGRVDVQLSDKDSVFVRFTDDSARQILTPNFEQFQTNSVSDNVFFTLEHKRIISANVLNTARVSHSILNFEQSPLSTAPASTAFVPGAPYMGTITVGGLTLIGNENTMPSTNDVAYWTYSDDLSWTRGRQLFKTGLLVERANTSKQTTTNSRGAYTFLNVTQFLAGVANRFQGLVPGANLIRERRNTLFGMYLQDDLTLTPRLTLNLGARYEFFTVPAEINGNDSYLEDIVSSKTFTVGPPFENPSLKNLSPRLGFAWDVGGNGRTSVRGGTGIYYDTDGTYNSAFGVAAFAPPFGPTITLTNPAFPNPNLAAAKLALSARTLDHNIKQPRGWTYNINLQRELWGDIVGTLGYAGSRGYNLVSALEANPYVPTTAPDGTLYFPAGAPRRNPAWGAIDYRTTNGHSTYNSLQASLLKRFSHGYQVQGSYTLSNTKDSTQAQLSVDAQNSSVYPQNPYDQEAEWGPAVFDIRHVFAGNLTWEVPYMRENPVLGGWQVNTIASLRSGLPFNPNIVGNWSRSGNTSGEDRPNLKPGVSADQIVLGGPDKYFDPMAFVLQTQGTLGNTPRDYLRGPGFANVDLSFVKNQAVRGSARAQVRIEIFNLLNRANFGVPTRTVFAGARADEAPLANAGRITRTVNSSRQIQIGVKFTF